ncbi:DUF6907 domain-containing protein [Streptomyces sp. NPDC102381]|uniref:DUF6907 domain-containing protein n=1 Tax=Streptomyces sp. NPDC102381 TaxID=3366164 RepID=UPI0038065E5C
MTHRTVTLPTLDHGEITLPEPSWCAGHAHHDPNTRYADVTHAGPESELQFRHAVLLAASICAQPNATNPSLGLGGAMPGISVFPLGESLDPAGADALAAALVEYAVELRKLARQLSAALGGER